MRAFLGCIFMTAVSMATVAAADTFSIKLTANALGLGTLNINAGKVVDPDRPGLATSPATGAGSVLGIDAGGLASPTATFLTVTATSRLDTLTFPPAPFPALNDYRAGILYVSKESTNLPDGRDEGLGVRAFTVVGGSGPTSGLRMLDAATGRARIEGSKEVSGGTGAAAYDPASPNGAPHVDEEATFTFDPSVSVGASTVVVVLSKFSEADILDLTVVLGSGTTFTHSVNAFDPAMEPVGDAKAALWRLWFARLPEVSPTDSVSSFSIRALDNNPAAPKGTAEHFLISAISGEATPGGTCVPPGGACTADADCCDPSNFCSEGGTCEGR